MNTTHAVAADGPRRAASAATNPPAGEEPTGSLPTRLECIEALEEVYDPEIPVNIIDLGLVYRLDVLESAEVEVDMTLTSLGCPEAPRILREVRERLLELPKVRKCTVNLVWDPIWTPEYCTPEGRLQLRIMGVPL